MDLLQMPLILLTALLAASYLIARHRSARHRQSRARSRPAPDRRRFSRAPQRHPSPRRDTRPQRERVMDLHARGAIFAATAAAQIEGYTCQTLGEVRVDAGPNHDTRLRRAAAQRYPDANALVQVQEVPAAQEWRAVAVMAAPNLPELATPAAYRQDLVLIDGSNVMNWEVDAGLAQSPSLRPLAQVLAALKSQGVAAGVVFDATAGHRLAGRFLGHDDLAAQLPEAADVLVVDKGTQADWVLVDMARTEGLVIISNDHFRDAPTARHLLKQKGFVEGDAVRLLKPRA